ncbi:MAG: hypothetical protein IJK18_07345 [Clostridia bacterium]|nr:hypothetical protein [Clostridia bacterium]
MNKLINNYLKDNATNTFKTLFVIITIIFIIPSLIYVLKNGTILGFNNYYKFFINDGKNKAFSTIVYLCIFIILSALYLYFVNKKGVFKNIKQLLKYVAGVSAIFLAMLPWHSSDIFYYMGVGELHSIYGQNPYYKTIKQYINENPAVTQNDTIMKQGSLNYWSNTTVVYGPVAQTIFSLFTKISLKNIDVCLLIFKLINLIVHLLNCYLIYKITKKLKFSVIYGLNPYILMEFIGMVHNDIIVVFLVLLSIYFLVKRKQILPSVVFLAIATGIKYFTILLLPIVVLYHYREEKKILKRILKCIKYGLIFLAIILIEYAFYYRDMSIFTAMLVQNEKFSKSIYSGIVGLGVLNNTKTINLFGKIVRLRELATIIRQTIFIIFVFTYVKLCIGLLIKKDTKLNNVLRKYNTELIIFMLSLGTFQQWYLVWLFATLPWQKSKMIKSTIIVALSSEIANTIYMIKTESYKYDAFFIVITIILFIIWKTCEKVIIDKRLVKW